MKKKRNREEIVESVREMLKSIRHSVSSLESHLDWTVKKATKAELSCSSGSRHFHIKAAKGYNEVIRCLLRHL